MLDLFEDVGIDLKLNGSRMANNVEGLPREFVTDPSKEYVEAFKKGVLEMADVERRFKTEELEIAYELTDKS
ncbi:hypothetical protein L596_007690 [Steinernema carpocapsae]|uniref:Uncharacterized protein n=1 Tax=Steinernema carpocapsae TaxID=34508 RepID=A0A4U5PA48_STECR|nr:hypothetical protein L596_007690 [Steinernema carpocapsae]